MINYGLERSLKDDPRPGKLLGENVIKTEVIDALCLGETSRNSINSLKNCDKLKGSKFGPIIEVSLAYSCAFWST